jgi:hypothetical protein
MTLGVIAITSTLTFACSSTSTTDPKNTGPASSTPDPADSWKSKLALSRPGGSAAVISALSKHGGATGTPKKVLSGGSGGSCGLASGDPTCDTCIDASCCAENTACVSDADCAALVACGDACRDDACISACMSAHPSGATKLDTLSSCVQTSCSSACGGPPPGGPPGSACGFGSGDATCDTCLDTNCCGDANACLADADCTALIDCAQSCADDACISACEAAHPGGTAKINALSTCADTTCGSACSGPSSGPGGPGGPATCGLTSGDATCDACLDGSCCAPTTTCIGDAECVALVRCYDGCADAACASACDAAHPTATPEIDAVVTCVQTSCSAACGL